MYRITVALTLLVGIGGLCGCQEEEPDEVGACVDSRWVTVDRDGQEVCFGDLTAVYNNPNSSNASFSLDGREGPNGATFSVYFTIPASGLELNTVYAVASGDYFSSEDIISGELMLLTYTAGVSNGAGTSRAKVTGTFSFVSQNPNSQRQTAFTNGAFHQN
ncbi:MAG: hypothetical protein RJQ14_20945 [Marinoscillum sp.]